MRRLHARDRGDRHADRPERTRRDQFRHRGEDRLLEPHADAAGDAAGRQQDDRPGRLPGSRADGAVPRHGRLSGGSARSVARRGGAQSRHPAGEAAVGAGADQHPARLLHPCRRHRVAGDRRIRAPGRRRRGDRRSGAAAFGGEVSGHPVGRRRRARRRHRRRAPRWPSGSTPRSPTTTSTTTASPAAIASPPARSATTARRRRWSSSPRPTSCWRSARGSIRSRPCPATASTIGRRPPS